MLSFCLMNCDNRGLEQNITCLIKVVPVVKLESYLLKTEILNCIDLLTFSCYTHRKCRKTKGSLIFQGVQEGIS